MRLCCLIAAVGCSYNSPSNGDADGPIPPTDGVNPDCMTWTFTPNEVGPCSAPAPGPELDIAENVTVSSDTGELVGVSGVEPLSYGKFGEVGVVSVASLRIGSGLTLRGIGTAPLAIMVWGDAEIEGTLEVASSIAAGPGAGAGIGCAAANRGLPGTAQNGGGGGGSFAADGGDGGDGNGGNGGNGGAPRAVPNKLEGGCEGADAGPNAQGTIGLNGAGGGSIALLVKGRLRISGIVHAGGAGGTGGRQDDNGGGGGGSGGMIKLQADDLQLLASATLAANGGQGGGGCQGGNASNGVDGRADAMEARVGNSEGGGTSGGGGGFLGRAAGAAAIAAGRGGGGGGGAVGYIIYKGQTAIDVQTATMSPVGQEF